VLLALLPSSVQAAPEPGPGTGFVWGVKAGAGGRYDDVRMCIATAPGVKGGAVAEVYLFAEVGRSGGVSATINLPVMRPVLFGAAFKMLQLEPDISIDIHHAVSGSLDLVYGPRLGLSFHYGPDYRSGPKDPERGPSFFAVGPKLGVSVGLWIKGSRGIDYMIGINPYFVPLFVVDDAKFHDGIVIGGMLEGAIRFSGGGG